MAGLHRFAILLAVAAACFGVLLVAASASSSARPPPELYVVGDGDEAGRGAPPGNDDDGTRTLRRWAVRQRFYVGDVLDFKRWSGSAVLLVRQGDYERCSAASPVRRFADDGGGTRFALARPGLFYFISGAPARCEAGQRMVVRVADPLHTSGAPTPTPTPTQAAAPAPGTTQPAATLSKNRRRPLSITQKQMVAGALGFAAGFIAIFLLVGLPICCCP